MFKNLTPPVIEEIALDFSTKQEREFYEAVFKQSKTAFCDYMNNGGVLKNFSNVFEMLLRLRQICDHPFLVFKSNDQVFFLRIFFSRFSFYTSDTNCM